MRLTCPRCRAQYQIADAAIPAEGREVECSACGHVWHEPGPGKPPSTGTAFDAGARPALHRPLDESILSILREETARELQAREAPAAPAPDHVSAMTAAKDAGSAATDMAKASPAPTVAAKPPTEPEPAPVPPAVPAMPRAEADPAPPKAAPAESPALADPEPRPAAPAAPDAWPAPVAPALPDAARLAATLTRPAPATEPAAEPHLLLRPDPGEQAETVTEAEIPPAPPRPAPVPPLPAAPVPAAAARPRRRGYATGFALALMLALALLAFYALAPRVAPADDGSVFYDLRRELDRGRLWLHDRILGK